MLAATLLAAVQLAATGAPAPVAAPWRTLVDDVGRRVTLARPPQRIVSTAPSNTGALFALGAGERVIGVTSFCADPPEARTRKKVGDFSSVDFETIVSLKPDLVVATWLEQRRAVDKLESLGLTVLVLYPTSIEEMLRSLERLGQATAAEAEAAKLIADLRRRLAAIDALVAAVPEPRRPRVLVELSRNPLYSAGPGSTVDEAIRRAGGRNIASDLGKPYATISRETVIARDPEVVLLGMVGEEGQGAARFAAEPGFAALAAVKSGRVHADLDPALLFHHNHRLVDGIELLFRLFHQASARP